MKTFRIPLRLHVLLLIAAALLWPSHSFAQGKVKIAIWEFDSHAEGFWFSSKLGPAARDQIDTEFSENPLLSSKFSVIERDKLNLVLKEQGLGASGAVDPASAAKVGKILGVKYILIGGVDKFKIDNSRTANGSPGAGRNLVQASATINLRVIDTTTDERIVSLSSDGEVKKSGGFLKGNSLSRDSEWGIASEAIQKAAKSVVAKFTGGDYIARMTDAAAPLGGVDGKALKVEANRAWINPGSPSGVKSGDSFNIVSIAEVVVDPHTASRRPAGSMP
jgi:curli biogenesis system outer membrane secretion channel CsgG